MRNRNRMLAAMLLGSFITACAPEGVNVLSHQAGLDCPADLASYCGGWTVYEAEVDEPDIHIKETDAFVIGRKPGNSERLSLFPRPTGSGGLLRRWKGQQRIDLREITSADGSHECLVGRVKLTDHPGGTQAHEWHGLTLRIESLETPEIGREDSVKLCLNPQTGGAWPRACAPASCRFADDDIRNHGGRAHARD